MSLLQVIGDSWDYTDFGCYGPANWWSTKLSIPIRICKAKPKSDAAYIHSGWH